MLKLLLNPSIDVDEPQCFSFQGLRDLVKKLLVVSNSTMSDCATLESLIAPNLEQLTRTVQLPVLDDGVQFELRPGLLRLLPKFCGTPQEDSIQHLDEVVEIWTNSRPSDLSEDHMMLRIFSFSLKDAARNWYHTLTPGSVATWLMLKKLLLDKYFPAIKRSQLRKQICNIEQLPDELLYNYFECFKKMFKGCSFHAFAQHDLILYFHEGLCEEDRRMVNVACVGNIVRRTNEEAWDVLAILADDFRQFNLKEKKKVPLVESSADKELAALKEELCHLKEKAEPSQNQKCDICHDISHQTLSCPSLKQCIRWAEFQIKLYTYLHHPSQL